MPNIGFFNKFLDTSETIYYTYHHSCPHRFSFVNSFGDIDCRGLSSEAVDPVKRLSELTQEGAVESVSGPSWYDANGCLARDGVPVFSGVEAVEDLEEEQFGY